MLKIKVYQLDNSLKRVYYNIDLKDIKDIKELVKKISQKSDEFDFFGNFDLKAIYVEKIPYKISKNKKWCDLTIILDYTNNSIRYFTALC